MIATTDFWLNAGILCCVAGLGASLAHAIHHLVLQWGEKPPSWKLVRLADGALVVEYPPGTTSVCNVPVENSKIAKLILEAANENAVELVSTNGKATL